MSNWYSVKNELPIQVRDKLSQRYEVNDQKIDKSYENSYQLPRALSVAEFSQQSAESSPLTEDTTEMTVVSILH